MRAALASLVLLACSHPAPPAERSAVLDGPACGSPTYRTMSAALDARCARAADDHETSACEVVREGFAACTRLLWRDAAAISSTVGRGTMAIYARPGRGEWFGAVFQPRGDAWIVTGFASGEIH